MRSIHCYFHLLCVSQLSGVTLSLPLPLPPWRGPRQLLHIGPWGSQVDEILSRLRSPRVLHVDLACDDDPKIKPLTALAPPSKDAVRVAFISDTHGKHNCIELPEADILVHCGDVLLRYGYLGTAGGGGASQLANFDKWLGCQPARHVLMIPGNHDKKIQKLKMWRPRNAIILDGATVHEAAGLTFFGSPYSPPGATSNDAFQQRSIGRKHAETLCRDVDVLVTHAKCREFEDKASKHARVWAHGHFHDQYGVGAPLSGCMCINAAICDMIYRPKNPPIVLDIIPSRTKL